MKRVYPHQTRSMLDPFPHLIYLEHLNLGQKSSHYKKITAGQDVPATTTNQGCRAPYPDEDTYDNKKYCYPNPRGKQGLKSACPKLTVAENL